MAQINICGVGEKTDLLTHILKLRVIKILLACETLVDLSKNLPYKFKDFNIAAYSSRADHLVLGRAKGGGAMILLHDAIPFIKVDPKCFLDVAIGPIKASACQIFVHRFGAFDHS